MRANRRVDTQPEVVVRSLLHRAGLRFRKDKAIPLERGHCRPDIVFPKRKVAIFIDGCFWHACPRHGTQPKHNAWYWRPKLRRNQARDRRVGAQLKRQGWIVRRFWEHADAPALALAIQRNVEKRRDRSDTPASKPATPNS